MRLVVGYARCLVPGSHFIEEFFFLNQLKL